MICGINQPEIIEIEKNLRLRKYNSDCDFALEWYKDEETVYLVDGVKDVYNIDKLYRMYDYLSKNYEVYFIEVLENEKFIPIGDVSFSNFDIPIVLGNKNYRNKGIGKKVINCLIQRAKNLGFNFLEVKEIYEYNYGSMKLFESFGFEKFKKTEKGFSYRLKL